jgi:hypothetical protein
LFKSRKSIANLIIQSIINSSFVVLQIQVYKQTIKKQKTKLNIHNLFCLHRCHSSKEDQLFGHDHSQQLTAMESFPIMVHIVKIRNFYACNIA